MEDLDLFIRAALEPETYVQPTLDGHVAEGDPDLPRRIRDEAALTLTLARTDTDPAEVAWAAGVMLLRDAQVLTGPVAVLAPSLEHCGSSLDGGRMYRPDRRGVRVTAGGRTVVGVGWDEVGAVVAGAQIPADLAKRIDDLAERRGRVRAAIAAATEADAEDLWVEADDLDYLSRCLAAQVWDLARPEDPMDILVRLLLDEAGRVGASSSVGTTIPLPLAE